MSGRDDLKRATNSILVSLTSAVWFFMRACLYACEMYGMPIYSVAYVCLVCARPLRFRAICEHSFLAPVLRVLPFPLFARASVALGFDILDGIVLRILSILLLLSAQSA